MKNCLEKVEVDNLSKYLSISNHLTKLFNEKQKIEKVDKNSIPYNPIIVLKDWLK